MINISFRYEADPRKQTRLKRIIFFLYFRNKKKWESSPKMDMGSGPGLWKLVEKNWESNQEPPDQSCRLIEYGFHQRFAATCMVSFMAVGGFALQAFSIDSGCIVLHKFLPRHQPIPCAQSP